MANNYSRCGYRFVPLICKAEGLACALDILFLRRDNPGDLIISGGDIDNRIKTLFDALRMPQECQELTGFSPEEGENPFFCLLEDDALITHVSINTDRLLTPLRGENSLSEVHLVIHVKIKIVDWNRAYIEFI
jgi:hypothetical protein